MYPISINQYEIAFKLKLYMVFFLFQFSDFFYFQPLFSLFNSSQQINSMCNSLIKYNSLNGLFSLWVSVQLFAFLSIPNYLSLPVTVKVFHLLKIYSTISSSLQICLPKKDLHIQ